MNRPVSALLQVAATVALVAIIFAIGLALPSERASGDAITVGAEERVLLFDDNDQPIEVLATLNTATSDVSIDRTLAEQLGINVAEAEVVTVVTPSGLEKRPVTQLTVQFAGTRSTVFATISDRTNLTTPLVIGRSVLGDVQVVVDQTQLTDPGEGRAPSTFEALIAATQTRIQSATMVALIPLAAVVMVALRQIIGIKMLGTFTPMLIAFSMLQVGIFATLAIMLIAVVVGLLVEPLLRNQRTPRLSRLGILIGVTAALIILLDRVLNPISDASALAMALPLVAIALVIERLYEGIDANGTTETIKVFITTLIASLGMTALFLSPIVRLVADSMPISMALACVIWIWLIGTYRGLRLTEVVRFRRAAREAQLNHG